jgi:hypothetical protein
MAESLLLKWGSLKVCNLESDKTQAQVERYIELGRSMSAIAQREKFEASVPKVPDWLIGGKELGRRTDG